MKQNSLESKIIYSLRIESMTLSARTEFLPFLYSGISVDSEDLSDHS